VGETHAILLFPQYFINWNAGTGNYGKSIFPNNTLLQLSILGKWTGEDCEAPSFTNIKSIKLTTTAAGDYENRSYTEQDCVYVLLFIHWFLTAKAEVQNCRNDYFKTLSHLLVQGTEEKTLHWP